MGRMRDYLMPDDPELKAFFLDYGHLITVMTHDTLQADILNQRNCPVLIMTTQRFIGLTRAEIKSYLKWNGGKRSRIIVDEQPYFFKQVDLSAEDIDKICSAIRMGIPSNSDGAEDREELIDFWDHSFKDYLNGAMDHLQSGRCTVGYQYQFYYKPNWQQDTLFDHIFALMKKHKTELNSYSQDFVDIWTRVVAFRQLFREGAIIHWRATERNHAPKFSLVLRNFSKFADLDAKVLILDGTADISTSYEIYREDLDIRDCSRFDRSLSNLYITIVDMATGKSSITMNAESTVEAVQCQLDKLIPEGCEHVMFSYKDMKSSFKQYFDDQHYDWFGNIKGKNDYRKISYISQVGVNRFPDSSYFMFELESNPQLREELNTLDYDDTMDIIKDHINAPNGFTHEAMIRELLADFEQNMFRGSIRNSLSTGDYHYYLFTSFRENGDLIAAIKRRYERLGAKVALIERPQQDRVKQLMERQGESIAKKIIVWHDTSIPVGKVYTYSDVAQGIQEDKAQIRDTCKGNKNKVLHELFEQERLPIPTRPATFKKYSNWQ